MQYDFSKEDKKYYRFLEDLGLLYYIQLFLNNHVERIQFAFEQILEKIQKKSEDDCKKQFIREFDREQFVDFVKITFCIMCAKTIMKLFIHHQQDQLSILTAQVWVKKMWNNPQDKQYVEQIDYVIGKCEDAILQAYESSPKS